MPRIRHALLLFTVVLLPSATAQEGPPDPAPELQKLAPFLGNWAGSGTAHMGPAPTKWRARGSYRWCLDGQFLQEDFEVTFEGRPVPMVFRAYLGWDREHRRYVNASLNNGGAAQLNEFHLLDDGTMLQVMHQHHNGLPGAERSRARVAGEAMWLEIDLLAAQGPAVQVIEGTLTRQGEMYEVDWDSKGFEGAVPAAALQQLNRSAGTYAVTGAMVMAPGQPEGAITGTDAFRPVFGGTIFHGHTTGSFAGIPGEYRGDVFWSYDALRRCLTGVYVSNFGEAMAMDAWWAADGQLVSVFAGTMGGQPMVQRMLLSFDDQGHAKGAVAHTISGTGEPFQSFRATYAMR